jgi:hypothetical protein
MHKKGALTLSINAIVILILAITMLGLGLAFMRNIFGQATGEFKEISGEVQKQMINQMKSTEKVVDLAGAVYKMKPGEKKMTYIAFKNTANTAKNFTIKEINANSLSGIDQCGTGKDVFLEYKDTPTEVQPGATLVLPINIKTASRTMKDSCFFEITVDTDYRLDNCVGDPINITPINAECQSSFRSTSSPYPCSFAYDGRTLESSPIATSIDNWISDGSMPQYVWFDLGQEKCISNVYVFPIAGRHTCQNGQQIVNISVSNSNFEWGDPIIQWSIPYYRSSNPFNWYSSPSFSETKGRYIRLMFTQGCIPNSFTTSRAGLMEFKATTRSVASSDASLQLTVNIEN